MDRFLVTTALPEYWDTGKSLLFLTDGSFPYCQPNYYRDYVYEVVPDPWADPARLVAAQAYIEQLYAQILPQLTNMLNDIHHKNCSIRYWEIIAGSWLRFFLSVFYDRYTCLKEAHKNYGPWETVALAHGSYVIAGTPTQFNEFTFTDIFNLQIYSFLLDELHIKTNKVTVDVAKRLNKSVKPSSLVKIKNVIRKAASKVFMRLGTEQQVLFADSGVSFKTLIKLFLKSKGKIVPITYIEKPLIPFVTNWSQRNKLLQISYQNEFERCVTRALAYFLPASFIETHQKLCEKANEIKYQPSAIFSAMGWHYNEIFKRYAADKQEQGVKLIGHQHGGDYGILNYHTSEMHETKVVDRYYTWGWDSAAENIQGFTGLKLRETKAKTHHADNDKILYGTGNGYRYLLRYNFATSTITKYFQFQQDFITSLSPALREKLQIRLYPLDLGWGREARFHRLQLDLNFQNANDIPFTTALAEAKLYVTDHISTTFAESFALNKPVFIFCDPVMYPIRPEAKPYFDELRAVGILMHDPVKAALALAEIDRDVAGWWQQKNRQEVVQRFRERFCRTASTDLDEWVKELTLVSSGVVVCTD